MAGAGRAAGERREAAGPGPSAAGVAAHYLPRNSNRRAGRQRSKQEGNCMRRAARPSCPPAHPPLMRTSSSSVSRAALMKRPAASALRTCGTARQGLQDRVSCNLLFFYSVGVGSSPPAEPPGAPRSRQLQILWFLSLCGCREPPRLEGLAAVDAWRRWLRCKTRDL